MDRIVESRVARVLIVALGLAFAPNQMKADVLVFTLNINGCSSGCLVNPMGTVTLTDLVSNEVEVQVQLSSDYSFRHAPDGNHWAFVFDTINGATISNITSGDTESQTFVAATAPSFKDAPFGNFPYALDCKTCDKGVPKAPTKPTQYLSFDVTATGLTAASFTTNGKAYFAADVVGIDSAARSGKTGNVGTNTPGTSKGFSTVPEPTSAISLATNLLGIALWLLGSAFWLRRRGSKDGTDGLPGF